MGNGCGAGRCALAPRSGSALRVTRARLLVATLGLVACLLASWWLRKWQRWLNWLATGADWVPVVLVTTVIALLCILTYRVRRNRSSATVRVTIVIGLTAISLVLGFTSYWKGTNGDHPTFVTPLLWTVSLMKGGIGDVGLPSGGLKNTQLCPEPMPVAGRTVTPARNASRRRPDTRRCGEGCPPASCATARRLHHAA
jgi:peptidoglycan/LPS O-acetylase OafA/YrhL